MRQPVRGRRGLHCVHGVACPPCWTSGAPAGVAVRPPIRQELRLTLGEAHEDELDVEAVLGYAEATLTDAAQLLLDAEPDQRVAL